MEKEEWQNNSANTENNGSRDGYRSSNRENNYQRRSSNYGERNYSPRPRFNRDEQGYSSRPRFNRDEQGYSSRPRFNRDEQGYASYDRPQRPRYNRDEQGHTSYDRPQGRPRFNRDEQGHSSYGRPQGRPRFNSNGERGYRSEYGNSENGERQNFQRGGFGGQRGGYQQRKGGYQQRQRTADYNPNAKYSMKKQIEYREYLEDPNAPIRLNKFLANAGVCSRREADQFIQAGVVTVNGQVVTELGTKVQRTDSVHFHDQLVSIEKKVYVLLNKPKDYVTTSDDPQQRKTVMDLVKNCCRERIYPVGRLDRNTTGVLLFTNDGEIASKLTHPKFLKKKIYHVYLDKNVTAADLRQIAEGITLEDGPIRADEINYASDTDKKQVGIEIHSGKNRIVRRIFESLGYRVCKLDRVMFAGLTKKGLKRGDWRFLTEQEVAMLHMGSFE